MVREPRFPCDESFNRWFCELQKIVWKTNLQQFFDEMDRNGLVSLLGSSVEQLTLAINKVHMMASYHEQNIFLIVATIPCCDLFCLRESLQGVWFASRLALFLLYVCMLNSC